MEESNELLVLFKHDIRRLLEKYDAKRTAERIIFQNERIKLVDCENLNKNKVLVIRCENETDIKVLNALFKSLGIIAETGANDDKSLVDLFFRDNELIASYVLWSPIEINGYIRKKRSITFKEFKKLVSKDVNLLIQNIQRKVVLEWKNNG